MSDQIKTKLQLAVALHQAGRLADAQAIYQEVLKLQPDEFNSLHLSGVIALQSGKWEEGLARIDRALAVNPASAAAHNNRGNALRELQKLPEALASYEKTLSLSIGFVDAWNNRGNVLLSLKRPEEALASFDRAVALQPGDAELHNNRGNALMELDRAGEALASYDRALTLKPSYAAAHNNRGNALLHLKRSGEALASYDKALALNPGYADAHNNRGNALKELGRADAALASYDKALALAPDNAEAHNNRGNLLAGLKRFDDALVSYRHALKLRPDYPFLYGAYLFAKTKVCDWRGLAQDLDRLAAAMAAGQKATVPFAALTLLDDPALHKIAAEVYTAVRYPARPAAPFPATRAAGKIRVGYYSADFHNHAVPYLMAELFEVHDKERFEFYGISIGPDKKDDMRLRLAAAFSTFLDVGAKSDPEIVQLSRELGIDIAVDLNGATEGGRTGIFAARCAPVQASYIGYTGTMGAPYIDYILADKTVIPPGNQVHFTESVAYIPDNYMVSDARRKVSPRTFTRAQLKLPEGSFVFCCFNACHKILPDTFDGWMRILRAVDGSVLWLLDDNTSAKNNLRKEARARGVDGDRLIFAERMAPDEHLARYPAADLFLDTLPYNAHTTASDALWLGVPVLTLLGHAFAGRVAASLVESAGLPELVTATQADFEAAAVALATDPERLRRVKAQVIANRTTMPVFDTRRAARHIEAAYEAMFARHQAGLPPAMIDIQP